MSRAGLFAVVGSVPLAAVVWMAGGSEEPGPGDSQARSREAIRDAVDRLGSSDRAERIAAERELLRHGTWQLPLLPEDAEVQGPAARAGLARIRKRLEEMKAAESVRPTLVSIEADGRPLGEVAAASGSAVSHLPFGTELALTPKQSARKVSLNRTAQPFWAVVDDAGRQAGLWPLELRPTEVGSRRLAFRDRTPEDDEKRIAYPAAFRVAVGSVRLRPVAGDDGSRLARVPVEILGEPRLRPLFVSYAAKDFELIDAAGGSWPPFTPGAKHELPVGEGDAAAALRLDFVAPSGAPRGPLNLTGKVLATVAAGQESFVGHFQEVETMRGVLPVRRTAKSGGVTVRFRDLARNDDGTAEVELAVVYDDAGPAFESHRAWVHHNGAALGYLTERDGDPEWTRIEPDPDVRTVAQADGGVVLRYRFSAIPRDASDLRFTYTAPTKIVEVPVEFEIEGLEVMSELRNSEAGAAEEDSRDGRP